MPCSPDPRARRAAPSRAGKRQWDARGADSRSPDSRPAVSRPAGGQATPGDEALVAAGPIDRKATTAAHESAGASDTRAKAAPGEKVMCAKAAPDRTSLYDEVTARVIAELEAGRLPWGQPWRASPSFSGSDGTGPAPALPRNALTGRRYSGVNVLIRWGAVIEQGFASQRWLTFRQAQGAGGSVRKGEHGTTIVYADRFVPKERDRAALRRLATPANRDEQDRKAVPFLKRFTVFNVAQCDGLDGATVDDPAPLPEREAVPVAEEVIVASGVDFHIGGDRAFYMPALDRVQVPPQPAFFEPINYYRTCLHELTHATGHPSRLDRQLTTSFGTKDYAREELVAEIGAAFLCAELGIVPTVRHADYIGAWLDLLRGDHRAIFRAASAASKAADWLLARRDAARAERSGVDGRGAIASTGQPVGCAPGVAVAP